MAGFMVGVLIAYLVWMVMSAADRQASNYYRECYNDLLVRYHEAKDTIEKKNEEAEEKPRCTNCREGIEWN